jgi:hypothetical protein
MSELADVCAYLCEADSSTLCLLIGEIERILNQRGEWRKVREVAFFQNNGGGGGRS